MVRAIFFDRDGVINDTINRGDSCFVLGKKVQFSAPWSYDEFKIKQGVKKILKKLKSLGFLLILVTNQPDVAYGRMSLKEHNKIMSCIKKMPFDDVLVCMHSREEKCLCKKPKPGMLIHAKKKYNINMKKSFIVGDSESDILPGKFVGCNTILINYEYNKNILSDKRIVNLRDIFDVIS